MTMYLQHFGLREAPFRITPHTEFFFSGANRGATLEALLYAITAGEGMVKVTGEVGSGKTMLCRVLMERLPDTVETIYLAVPSLTRDEMLAAIAGDLGIDTAGANTTRLVRSLQEKLIEVHAAGRQVVALIDEAHAMPLATLEEIRLLSNLETGTEKLIQIVLFGQPELDEHLSLPNMRQLKERITHSFTLAPLPAREVDEYINFRLRAAGYHGPALFGPEALRIIAEASEGLTRRINIFSDKTLLAAFAAGTHTVTADHARAAISDTRIVMSRKESPRRMAVIGAIGIAAGVAIGFGVARFLQPAAPPAVAARAPAADPGPTPAPVASAPVASAQVASAPVAAGPVAASPIAAAPVAAPTVAVPTVDPPPAAVNPVKAQPIPVAATERAPASAAPAASRNLVEARLAAGKAMLDDPQGARYAIQLMVTDARERDYLQQYLRDAGRAVAPEKLYAAPIGSPESPRVSVLFGTYAERPEAVASLASLPDGLRQFRPYVRPLEAIREEVRRAEGK